MLGFHRVPQRGYAISSRKGRVFISVAGKIYRAHVALGTFSFSWERPYRKG